MLHRTPPAQEPNWLRMHVLHFTSSFTSLYFTFTLLHFTSSFTSSLIQFTCVFLCVLTFIHFLPLIHVTCLFLYLLLLYLTCLTLLYFTLLYFTLHQLTFTSNQQSRHPFKTASSLEIKNTPLPHFTYTFIYFTFTSLYILLLSPFTSLYMLRRFSLLLFVLTFTHILPLLHFTFIFTYVTLLYVTSLYFYVADLTWSRD